MKKKMQVISVLAAAFLLPAVLHAQGKAATPSEQTVLESSGFIGEHPDIFYRLHGIKDLQAGMAEQAFARFRMAARYADKPSQAMIASMYWEGKGVEQNRALAYAWMDLAAERYYPDFLAQREQYWVQLSEAERQQAIAQGTEVYARYGDDVALERVARELRRQKLRGTGSRTGYTGALTVHLPVPGAGDAEVGGPSTAVDGSRFYARKFWNPREYRAWQDAQWGVERTGQVHVGDLKTVRREDADKKDAVNEKPEKQDP